MEKDVYQALLELHAFASKHKYDIKHLLFDIYSIVLCSSDPHLTNYLEEEFLEEQVIKYFYYLDYLISFFFRLNQSRKLPITLPTYVVLVLVLVNMFSIKTSTINYLTKKHKNTFFFLHAYIIIKSRIIFYQFIFVTTIFINHFYSFFFI
jgi:hypothetical protein